jgi:hypothetical protein
MARMAVRGCGKGWLGEMVLGADRCIPIAHSSRGQGEQRQNEQDRTSETRRRGEGGGQRVVEGGH